jgi:GNAT superfamily N-acetyltransferase
MIIRSAHTQDADGIARVYVDSWRTTYPGIVPEKFLTRMSYEEYTHYWRQILSNFEGFIYVVEEELGEIVGFIWGGRERSGDPIYKSELYALYILKTYQGQGLGRRLTQALVEKLIQEGRDSMLVWVLAANPSRRFYEKLGGQLVRTGTYEIGGVMLEDVAYGWKNIFTLM